MTPLVTDSLFENSKLNKLESECYDSDCSNSEEAFVSKKTEKIKNRKPTGKRRRKSAAELEKINKNYEINQSLEDSWQVQEDWGLDMQEKTAKVRFNSSFEINTEIPEIPTGQTEKDFIEKIIPDKKLEESQKIDSKNKEEIGDVTSEPNKNDNNVDTDQQGKSDDVKSAWVVSVSSKIPQYAGKRRSEISESSKKPSSLLPRPIRPNIKL